MARSFPVYVNIYDLHDSNAFLSALGTGFYHSGVEIDGWEYSFSNSGVSRTRPQLESFGRLKDHILMGTYVGSASEWKRCIHELGRTQFKPGEYNLTTLNCNHFSEALLLALVGEPLPAWVNRMATIGSYVVPKSMTTQPSSSTGSDALPAPGKVAPPTEPAPAQTRPIPSPNSNSSGGIFSSIFGFFGGSSSDTSTLQPAATPKSVAPPAQPQQKKQLTEKQVEALAKVRGVKS